MTPTDTREEPDDERRRWPLIVLALVVIPVASVYIATTYDSAENGVYSETRDRVQHVLLWGLGPLITFAASRPWRPGILTTAVLMVASALLTW